MLVVLYRGHWYKTNMPIQKIMQRFTNELEENNDSAAEG